MLHLWTNSRITRSLRLAGLAGLLLSSGYAIAADSSAPLNMVRLSASASIEIPKDWLSITLQASRDGTELAQVQKQLKQSIDAALNDARAQARPGELEVRSGPFNVSPRYGRDGRINGWQGSAELLLEGRDVPALAALAGRLGGLAITGSNYSISRQARERVENELQAEAVQKFRARAAELARQFGASGYTIGEVTVQSAEEGLRPMPMMRALAVSAAPMDAAPLPTEAGKGLLSASVQGSIQLGPAH
ncbi:MAG: hypothetical protein RJA44_435 [Pseudomonadota bacterium]|jgi:predicted secreted protein